MNSEETSVMFTFPGLLKEVNATFLVLRVFLTEVAALFIVQAIKCERLRTLWTLPQRIIDGQCGIVSFLKII